MGQVIAMPMSRRERIEAPLLVYCYGSTILANAEKPFRDNDGRTIEPEEFYEVTPNGIRRI